MRLIFSLGLLFYTLPSICAQDLEGKLHSDIGIEASSTYFESELSHLKILFGNNKSSSFINSSSINFKINIHKLNKNLFSNLHFIENTYINFNEYLRGCGPLVNGISSPINSGELILSITIDNFINNILFPKGVFSSLLNH